MTQYVDQTGSETVETALGYFNDGRMNFSIVSSSGRIYAALPSIEVRNYEGKAGPGVLGYTEQGQDLTDGIGWVETNIPQMQKNSNLVAGNVIHKTLHHALMTAPDKRDPELLAKLDVVAGRVLA